MSETNNGPQAEGAVTSRNHGSGHLRSCMAATTGCVLWTLWITGVDLVPQWPHWPSARGLGAATGDGKQP